jgi:two-component system OmpR family sensor kinase
MALRGRLTLLYTSLLGGILLLFGVAVYGAVSFTITAQVEDTLRHTVNNILADSRVDPVGELNVVILPSLTLPNDVYFQIWGQDGLLHSSWPKMSQIDTALDSERLNAVKLGAVKPVFNDVKIGDARLRVLTVPLLAGKRPAGVLQVGAKLAVVDSTQRTLLIVLAVGSLLALSIASLAMWISADQTLKPLQGATQVAQHIAHADDLSRRIPYRGPPEDEVGQLIRAFNHTLSRLENQFHMQRRFMADVGHELRTPLTVVKGNIGLMRRMGQTDKESLDSIDNEVDRLTRLVGDLLLLAQAEAGKIPLNRSIVELDTLVLEVLSEMHVLAGDKLQLRLGDIDQVLVCGDRDRLKQVLVNLVGNGIMYTPAGGEVLVGLGKENNQARLTVSDNGPGIPAETLPHIFERFFRAEKSRTRSKQEGKGFGLGLSIAYWIVRNHEGRIEVTSKEGRGTTFCVWLPLSDGSCGDES